MPYRRRVASGLLLLSAFGLALARRAGAADSLEPEIHPAIDLVEIGYPAPAGGPTTQFQSQVRLSVQSTFKYRRDLELVFDPEALADPLNPSVNERYWADLPEGYLQGKWKAWTLQLGYNTFTWGVTDGYNPLDVVSARRFQDPLRSEKLGAYSVTLRKDVPPFSFEGIYIPWQRQTLLPGANSRWLPREVLSNRTLSAYGESATLTLPPDFFYDYEPSLEYDGALESNYGFRVQGQGILPGLDAQLAYFQGASPAPAVNLHLTSTVVEVYPEIVAELNPEIDLIPVYYRQEVYGGSLVYAAWDMIFRFETAITRVMTKAPGVPGSMEEYVLAAEHSFPMGDNPLTAVFQASYAHHSDPLDNTTASLYRIFDRALMLGGRYSFNERITAMVSALEDLESDDQLLHLEGSYALSDAVKVTLAGDGIWGSPASPLGVYHENDRVIASLTAMF